MKKSIRLLSLTLFFCFITVPCLHAEISEYIYDEHNSYSTMHYIDEWSGEIAVNYSCDRSETEAAPSDDNLKCMRIEWANYDDPDPRNAYVGLGLINRDRDYERPLDERVRRNLSDYTYIKFWAKGNEGIPAGREVSAGALKIEFNNGRGLPPQRRAITNYWREYEIDIP